MLKNNSIRKRKQFKISNYVSSDNCERGKEKKIHFLNSYKCQVALKYINEEIYEEERKNK